MMAGLLPSNMAFTPATVTAYADDSYSHCICGVVHSSIGDHKDEDIKGFTAWPNEGSLPTDADNYCLTNDVTISDTWHPANGAVLCLNGHTIMANGDFDVIQVDSGVTFTLTDFHEEEDMGKITRIGGTHRGVYVDGSGAFNIYGGSITGNIAYENGGGVYNHGTFTMYGGSITGNNADSRGGGVCIEEGRFNVKGDVNISGNVLCGTLNDDDNYIGDQPNNVYLKEGKTIYVKDALTGNISEASASSNYPVTVAKGDGYTLSDADLEKFASDNTDYGVVLDEGKNEMVLNEREILKADDFNITLPSDLTYSGNAKEAMVEAKDGIECGAITVKYCDA